MKTIKQIMTEAHKIAKSLEGDYMARMSMALKMAWKSAKEKTVETFELVTGYAKAINGATYKQIEYLRSFSNVSINTSSSQIMKRLNVWEVSEAIDAAKKGLNVIIS
jgi:DNA-binding NarL/FixJ family response regulator